MNPLKQRELCGQARRRWASQHDSENGGGAILASTVRDLVGRWPNVTLFFSVQVYEQVKTPCRRSLA